MKNLLIILIVGLTLFPAVVFGQAACTKDYSGAILCNAFPSFAGLAVTDAPTLIAALFGWVASVIGTLALVMVIYSGMRMIVSRGDSSAVTTAKSSMTYAITGLVVVVFAFVIVSSVQNFIGFNDAVSPGGMPGGEILNPLDYSTLRTFVPAVMKSVLSIAGTIAMLYIIIAGFRYVTAGANEAQATKAKEGITWAIIGLISTILSYLIVTVVINFIT